MTPKLPRELLWRDITSMDEFLIDNTINQEIYQTYVDMEENSVVFKIPPIRLFNEVYYQITKMVYEWPSSKDLVSYANDIKANLGWSHSADLVLTIVYQIVSLINYPPLKIDKHFTSSIRRLYFNGKYWKPFKNVFIKLRKQESFWSLNVNPRPITPSKLESLYIRWEDITGCYSVQGIQSILNLWPAQRDKCQVAKIILRSFQCIDLKYASHSNTVPSYIYETQSFLEKYVSTEVKPKSKNHTPFQDDLFSPQQYDLRLDEKDKTIAMLHTKIEQLESENESYRSELNNEKPKRSKERSFTLQLIVDYCKKKYDYNDVRPIMAMLYKFLRNGTEEEQNIVDSIDDIFNRRQNGNTFVEGDYVNTKHVTNEVNGVAEGGTGINVNK